jgi:endoglycosylceramidase
VRPLRLLAAALLLTTLAAVPATDAAAAPVTASRAVLPLGKSGTWVSDATGRVVILHGLNQVYKVPPYLPSADGFGDDDAAFLAANGFTVVRVGVIWGAVEPRPGGYDDAYLTAIAATVQTLAQHGIVSLLDFHQDLYSEKFQGEGAPAWAVPLSSLPNPPLGFPGNYFANPAENATWDAFWRNAPAPDGVGLQTHYARAWAHVAARFRGNPAVLGYEVMNEPWPGTLWSLCLVPLLGCPLFDHTLTTFYHRVLPAIRAVDPTTTIWLEPNVLFNEGIATNLGPSGDPRTGFAFHDYCGAEALLQQDIACRQEDTLTFDNAARYTRNHAVPPLVTEFGATNDLADLAEVTAQADRTRMGWIEWAYTGGDKTSSSPDGQALVLDPSQPPTGANVLVDKLRTLAAPYPKVVAGTPTSWAWRSGTFTLTYTTARPAGGTFAPGSVTAISTPAVEFPNGYAVTVTGGHVVSAPNAATLLVASTALSVTVTARALP